MLKFIWTTTFIWLIATNWFTTANIAAIFTSFQPILKKGLMRLLYEASAKSLFIAAFLILPRHYGFKSAEV